MSKYDMITLYGPLVLIALALVWGFARMTYLSRTKGVSVLAFVGRKRTGAESVLALTAIALDGYLIARPFAPGLDRFVMTAPNLYAHYGVAVMALGIAIAVLSQADMGKAWRIGVPSAAEESQSLVTTGLYRFSRNPIYVGIMLFIVGSVIAAPGPVTILSLILTWVFVNKIIDSEEAFLRTAFGEEFEAYCTHTRRWL
ncbi:methyltransferase family protein [Kordiimonas gwangyangensis]|uniref:methyltransferase family protein n=1 Tax=Kordiimonas gwangyangensis TaxID=288022 RepID=UPI000362033E|nr:isoprenylcysteine carboxylmethyltransferase family protein [Kordiimonas gwangyangensis]